MYLDFLEALRLVCIATLTDIHIILGIALQKIIFTIYAHTHSHRLTLGRYLRYSLRKSTQAFPITCENWATL